MVTLFCLLYNLIHQLHIPLWVEPCSRVQPHGLPPSTALRAYHHLGWGLCVCVLASLSHFTGCGHPGGVLVVYIHCVTCSIATRTGTGRSFSYISHDIRRAISHHPFVQPTFHFHFLHILSISWLQQDDPPDDCETHLCHALGVGNIDEITFDVLLNVFDGSFVVSAPVRWSWWEVAH